MVGALLVIGCSHPPQPGSPPRTIATLTRYNQTVPLTTGHLLHLHWSIAGVEYRTQAVVQGRDVPIPVTLVAADSQYLHVRSPAWNTPADIPRAYQRTPDLAIDLRASIRPTLLVPRRATTAVGVEERVRVPVASRLKPRHLVIGAATGAAIAAGATTWESGWNEVVSHTLDSGEGKVVLTGAATGALVYSAYKLITSAYGTGVQTYRIDPDQGWQLRVRGD